MKQWVVSWPHCSLDLRPRWNNKKVLALSLCSSIPKDTHNVCRTSLLCTIRCYHCLNMITTEIRLSQCDMGSSPKHGSVYGYVQGEEIREHIVPPSAGPQSLRDQRLSDEDSLGFKIRCVNNIISKPFKAIIQNTPLKPQA